MPICAPGRSGASRVTAADSTSSEPIWESSRMRTRAAIVGVHNTRQGRRLDGETSRSLALAAIRGALDDAGLTLDDVDGISASPLSTALIYDLRIGPAWQGQ